MVFSAINDFVILFHCFDTISAPIIPQRNVNICFWVWFAFGNKFDKGPQAKGLGRIMICFHNWKMDSSRTVLNFGTCRMCGSRAVFKNSILDEDLSAQINVR